MRPALKTPLLLLLAALALPAGAQVKIGAAADAAAGTGQVGSSFNSGGVTPIGLFGTIVPLTLSGSLSPSLAAPAVSLNQGLAPSALVTVARPAASAADKPAPKAAADSGGPPGGPPAIFIDALLKLGVPEQLAMRLSNFLAERHPGDQNAIYHGLAHSREVADLAALIVTGQSLPAEKKILLILSAALHDVDPERVENTPARVSATLDHLDKDDEARALLLDFGSRYGFTAAQVKALIMATDFAMDPVQMKQKQDDFAKAAVAAFPSEPDWALDWGKRLAFADQSSTYAGSIDEARKRVEGLAVEIRAQLEAIGKGPGPSDAVMLAGSFKFLSVLRQNTLFAILPPEQRRNFDAVLKHFETRQTPESWAPAAVPPPARAPPKAPDLDAARRYINGIMGGVRAPTERETDALLGDWLDENSIPRGSPRAAAVRQALAPGKAAAESGVASKLNPKLRRHAALLIRVAAEHKVTVPFVESVMTKRGLLQYLDSVPDEALENQIDMALRSDALDRAVAKYPDNAQGELLRGVASAMSSKGGNSIEEITRAGVFLYADFRGNSFLRGYASRDPDIQQHTIAFYVTRADGKWRIDGYRQKANGVASDQSYIDALKSWLRSGGIPSSDLK